MATKKTAQRGAGNSEADSARVADARHEARSQVATARRIAAIDREIETVKILSRSLAIVAQRLDATKIAHVDESPAARILRALAPAQQLGEPRSLREKLDDFAADLIDVEHARLVRERATHASLPHAKPTETPMGATRRILMERGASSYEAVRLTGNHADSDTNADLPTNETRAAQRAAQARRADIRCQLEELKKRRAADAKALQRARSLIRENGPNVRTRGHDGRPILAVAQAIVLASAIKEADIEIARLTKLMSVRPGTPQA